MLQEPETFRAAALKSGLKITKQREEIFRIFLRSRGHRNLAEIYDQVRKIDPKIGFATVYRTMKLLTELGLAAQRKFADGMTQYEPLSGQKHHDHLICLDCGRIIEFEDAALEALQAQIAEKHRFEVFHHRMELYGICAQCSARRPKRKKG